jgi:hypothetical protein
MCDGTPQPWTADVRADNGTFAGGRATAHVTAELCFDAFRCVFDDANGVIRLTG